MRSKENTQDEENKKTEKMIIPTDVQKRMLEFFMQTSIPRKKRYFQNQELQKIQEIQEVEKIICHISDISEKGAGDTDI